MKHSIIYTRVSTDEQASSGHSLSYQEDRLRKYCAEQNMEAVHHFQDDYSAKTFDRPAFKEMLQYIRRHKGKISYVLVTKWDRFSRAGIEETGRVLGILQDLKVELIAIEQPLDNEVPENEILRAVYIAQGRVENRRRSLNTLSGMVRAKEQGRWVTTPPMGYKFARDEYNKPKLVHNHRAEFIRKLFHEFADHQHSVESIRRWAKKTYGVYLSKSQAPRVLRNQIYVGEILIVDPKTGAKRTVNGIHSPLVDRDTFDKVQRILASYGQKRRRINFVPEFPLRGVLYCKHGHKMTASFSRGKMGEEYGYYHCQSPCRERYRSSDLNENIVELLRHVKPPKAVQLLYRRILEKLYSENKEDVRKEIRRLNVSIETNERKLLDLDLRLLAEKVETDSYMRLKNHLRELISEDTERRDALRKIDENFLDHIRNGMNLLSDIDNYYLTADPEQKAAIVSSIFPLGVIWSGSSYRTPDMNEFIRVMLGNSTTSEDDGMSEMTGISRMVPPRILISNKFARDLLCFLKLRRAA